MDMSALGAALASLNAAKDIAQAMIGFRDAAAFQSKMIEFQSKILDAQASAFAANDEHTALIESIRQLEAKVAELETWETQKQRYELREVAPRMFVYVLKMNGQVTEPPHWICPACYEQRKKSILQGFESHTFGWSHTCPSCRLEIRA